MTTPSAWLAPARLGPRGAPLLIAAAAFSVQGGAALATTMFDRAGPLGTVLLRVGFAAVILAAWCAPRRRLRRPDRTLFAFAVALAAMNALFYEALDRVPLGVGVTAELLGPLAVAVLGSQRRIDYVWIVLAVAGVVLLGSPTLDVDALGLVFALLAGGCWALYIVLGKRVAMGGDVVGGLGTAMLIGMVLLLPWGIAGGGAGLGSGDVLWRGLCVALLSSVLPYLVELAALRLIRASAFGIMMSLEPAVAALCGAVFLGQGLHGLEALAIVLVIAASAGASLRGDVARPAAGEP